MNNDQPVIEDEDPPESVEQNLGDLLIQSLTEAVEAEEENHRRDRK